MRRATWISLLVTLFISSGDVAKAGQDVLKVGTVEYHSVYAKRPDPKYAPAVTVSVSIEAVNVPTGKRTWIRELSGIHGHYADRSYEEMRYTLDQLTIGKFPNGANYLYVATRGRMHFLLDPENGKDLLVRYREQPEQVPWAQNLKIELRQIELVGIQAMPGYGVHISLRNGPHTLILEPSYIPFLLEGLDHSSKTWRVISDSRAGNGYLTVVPAQGDINGFIPAKTFEALIDEGYTLFEPSFRQRTSRRDLGPMDPKFSPLVTPALSGSQADEFRLVLVLGMVGQGNEGPVGGVVRTAVPLSIQMLKQMIAGE